MIDLGLTVIPTEDGGMTYEVEREDGKRDVLFAHPDNESVLYFTLRDHAVGTRQAGIVREQKAIFALLRWVNSDDTGHPTDGLEFG